MNQIISFLRRAAVRSALCALFIIVSGTVEAAPQPQRPSDTSSRNEATRIRVGIKFRHHGSGASCNTPLGLCITIPFRLFNPPRRFTSKEIAEGFGTADFEVAGDRLHMVFHRAAALPDGTIKIERNKVLERDIANALGYERIVLKTGSYKVNLSKQRFGETFVPIEKGPRTSTQGFGVVTCYRYANTTGNCKGCGVACDDKTNYPMDCGAALFADMTRCGGQKISYDPREFETPKIFVGTPEASVTPPKGSIVKKFDSTGAEVKTKTGAEDSRHVQFTLVVPRLRQR